jgi:hypothetical protein
MKLARIAAWTALLLTPLAACDCEDPLVAPSPRLQIDPEVADLTGVAVGQDTVITFTLTDPSSVPTVVREIFLREPGTDVLDPAEASFDPAFTLVDPLPTEIPASLSEKVEVVVRPRLVSTIRAELVVIAEEDAFVLGLPQHPDFPHIGIVPISVQAEDFGQPDIVVDPARVDFGRIGQNDVARATLNISNVGVRDLIMDPYEVVPLVEGDDSFSATGGLSVIQPGETQSLEVIFRPTDTEPHKAGLILHSNDPDEPELLVPLIGLGSQCPIAVAELLDGPDDLEPLDTVRIDGHNSFAESAGTEIAEYQWSLGLRPQGSTTTLEFDDGDRTQLTCDIAGDYEVRLEVTDTDGVRSCNDAVIEFTCGPTEDLHLQLVWDHPTADLDLHLLREGGSSFTHEGDCYFSNREPEWFPDNPESDPSLDQDDNRGYGPENINIVTPLPNSRWTILVHYWNKQTDGDQFVNATLRVYARGQLVSNLTQSFETEQVMWNAAEIVWPDNDEDMPVINLVNTQDPFPRPF